MNAAATLAKSMGMTPPAGGTWILSVGATPTAHAATQIEQGKMDLEGVLELYVTFQPLCTPTSYISLFHICFD